MDHGVKAYFTLSFKEIILDATCVSKSKAKKLDGISKNADNIRAFLLGQIGKADTCGPEIKLDTLMNYVYQLLAEAQGLVGGRVILLECEDNDKLISLYENCGFERLQSNDFVQMYKIFDGIESAT